MLTQVYNLPEITFVGGATQNLTFNMKTPNGAPYTTVNGCELIFSIVNYSNRDYGSPIILYKSDDEIPKIVAAVDSNLDYSKIIVKLDAEATATLSGKYIYQIELIDASGHREIPGQGIMNIIRNISSGYRRV